MTTWIPTTFTKGDEVQVASSPTEYIELLFDGWTPGNPLPGPSREHIVAHLSDLDNLAQFLSDAAESAQTASAEAVAAAAAAQAIANGATIDSVAAALMVNQDSDTAKAVADLVELGTDGTVVKPSGDNTGNIDYLAMELGLTTYGGIRLVDSLYTVSPPVRLRSFQKVSGKGMGRTTVRSLNNGSLGACFWTGQFHPFNYGSPGFAGVWTQDAINVPANNATQVIRDTVGFNLAVGQLVMVKTFLGAGYDNAPFGHLRRVVSISNDQKTIGLHKPLDGLPPGLFRAVISPGTGGYFTVGGVQYATYLAERCSITDLAVESTHASWLARSACLEGEFRNIYVKTSEGFIFGNAFTDCTFENIRGNYRARCIEIVDGARDNTVRNIRAVWIGDREPEGYTTSDPVVKLGHGDTLTNFDITDYANDRLGSIYFGLTSDRNTVRDGTFRIDSRAATGVDPANPPTVISASPHFQFSSGKVGQVFDNIKVDIRGILHTHLFNPAACTDVNVTKVVINGPNTGGTAGNGRDTGIYTVNVGTGADRVVMGITDPNGNDNWNGSGPANVDLSTCSWRSPLTGRLLTGSAPVNTLTSDIGRTLTFNRNGDQALTVATAGAASRDWSINHHIRVRKTGTGALTVAPLTTPVSFIAGSTTISGTSYSDVFTSTGAHGMTVDMQVFFTGLSPSSGTGLTNNTVYFVKSVPNPTSFQLSATQGGAVLDVLADGTATMQQVKLIVDPSVPNPVPVNTEFKLTRLDATNVLLHH